MVCVLFHQDKRDGTAFGMFLDLTLPRPCAPFKVQQHLLQPACVPSVFLEDDIVMAESSSKITLVVKPIRL